MLILFLLYKVTVEWQLIFILVFDVFIDSLCSLLWFVMFVMFFSKYIRKLMNKVEIAL